MACPFTYDLTRLVVKNWLWMLFVLDLTLSDPEFGCFSSESGLDLTLERLIR